MILSTIMKVPELYSRKPILSAPLRWRIELAAFCLCFGVIDRWLPWQVTIGPTILIIFVTLGLMIYAHAEDADPHLLESNKPKLALSVFVLCSIGILFTFLSRLMSGDFISHDGFFLFLLGSILSNSAIFRKQTAIGRKSNPTD